MNCFWVLRFVSSSFQIKRLQGSNAVLTLQGIQVYACIYIGDTYHDMVLGEAQISGARHSTGATWGAGAGKK